MSKKHGFIAVVVAFGIFGCASQSSAPPTQAAPSNASASKALPAAPDKPTRVVKGPDGKEIGEYIGPMPAPNSKFAKLKFGMTSQQVMNAIGAPSNSSSRETGKRWIPFYFGADIRKLDVLYAGEGCLTYTGGNQFGGGADELIAIETDPKGACFSE